MFYSSVKNITIFSSCYQTESYRVGNKNRLSLPYDYKARGGGAKIIQCKSWKFLKIENSDRCPGALEQRAGKPEIFDFLIFKLSIEKFFVQLE